MIIDNNELVNIVGGGISGTLINSIVKAASFLLELGRAVGSAIRSAQTGVKCKQRKRLNSLFLMSNINFTIKINA